MTKIIAIRVNLDEREIAEKLSFDYQKRGEDDLAGLVALARGLIAPRAALEVGYIGAVEESNVEIGGITFVSPVLRDKLDKVNKAFPFILTIGPELERAASAQEDLLRQYYLEEIANLALDQATGWLGRHIEKAYGVSTLSSLSPGSLEDWPITEQRKLFSLFGDTEKLVGVRLNESLLMVPRKSISGIFFPSEEGFTACQLCERERCPGRKAPFQGAGSS